MTEKQKLTELMERRLTGQITPEDLSWLEKRIADDPAIAEMMRETELAFKVIQHAARLKLKEKLKALDKEDWQKQGFFSSGRTGFFFILMLLLVFMLSLMFIVRQPAAIAKKNIVDLPEVPAAKKHEYQQAWRFASGALKKHDCETAIRAYAILASDEHPQVQQAARWNMLMAQLASEGLTAGWKTALVYYRDQAPEPYRSMADRVGRQLNSWVFRWSSFPFQQPLQAIKPRLI